MELVMLEETHRKELASQEQQQKEKEFCNVVIYDPSPAEIVDKIILKKLTERKRTEKRERRIETKERNKLLNAVTLTDVQATIKKAGFHPDGSPKVAIAGLFDDDVSFIVKNGKAKYCSGNLEVVLANIKIDWRELICFIIGILSVVASVWISIINLDTVLFFVGIILPILALVSVCVELDEGICFSCLKLPGIGKVRLKSDFYTNVPPAPESVLAKISGHGPFAILFQVTEGWRKADPDPVILRVINIKGKQFFEPVVGYDMTPLEKSSLVPV